jgi:cystathionine beta-lyase
MEKEISCDFDRVVSRAGTHAEKYELRKSLFGKADVEPFWVADMDLPAPDFLVEKLRERISHPMFGYTGQYDAVFESILWWMHDQHDVAVERSWISLAPSVVTAISLAIQSLTEPGDTVAVLSPVYGPFFSCTTVNDRQVADCPLRVEQGRFAIDFDRLAAALAEPRTKMMLLSNPHNPGGRVWSVEELERIAGLCAENNVVLFSDEIHCDIVYPPLRHTSLLAVPAAREIGIVAHSIGKTFNASGLQSSFSIIPDAQLRSRFRAGLEKAHVGDVNLLAKVALANALSPAGADYKRQLVGYLQESTRQVCARLREGGFPVMVPEATFLVWCDFRGHGSWPEVARRLVDEANVALSGGTFFGTAGEGWFRINCAHPRTVLFAAVDRIVKTFNPAEPASE